MTGPARTAARRAYLKLLAGRTRELKPDDLGGPAIVFAPHPDDETLGCGGTVITMVEGGVDVSVVFMTDGRKSHRALMDEEELAGLRKGEGLEACSRLGVAPGKVHFLGIHNGKLGEERARALPSVLKIIGAEAPRQVFIPYGGEPPVGSTDHWETSSIVREALGGASSRATVLEYPVWYWRHWPMVSSPHPGLYRASRFSAKSALWAARLLRDFNCRSATAAVEARKRYALEAHRTQMSRYLPDSDWQTLSDVSSGQFLECFFLGFEVFRCHPSGSLPA